VDTEQEQSWQFPHTMKETVSLRKNTIFLSNMLYDHHLGKNIQTPKQNYQDMPLFMIKTKKYLYEKINICGHLEEQ